jgi:hypothetical protein
VRSHPGALPRVVAHADWSMHPQKRWLARAILQPSGRYRALPPEPVGALDGLFERLGADGESREGAVLLGVDFPIGLPKAYAACAGIDDFIKQLARFDDTFYAVARQPSEICITRPFYPCHAGRKGTVSRQQLLNGLGMADPDALRRRCEKLANASPLFWTLGAKQVGRAAISGWSCLLAPALHGGLDLAVWPFQGPLFALLAEHRYVVAETYPGEIYRHLALPLTRPGGGSKRHQASRRACAPALFGFARDRLELDRRLKASIDDGFGPSADAEDPFDAAVGLFGMLNVVLGQRATGEPDDPSITRIEGWILGRSPR